MRILIVNDFASINGGASRVALTSAIGLAQAGHGVAVFAGAGPIDPKLAEAGVEVVCLNAKVFQQRPAVAALRQGLWDAAARESFGKLLDKFDRADTVVHIHTNRDVLSASVPSLAIERGFAVVYTCHEYFIGCPYGAFFDLRLGIRCPERGMSFGCWTRPCNGTAVHKKLWSMTRSVMHERAGIPSQIRDFVFVSEFSQQILEPHLPKDARRHQIDNPVAVVRQTPKTFDDGEQFVSVGALANGKDPIAGAKAAHQLNHKVVYLGDGPLREELSSMPGAHVRGWVDETELVEAYRSSRALIFTPIWPETQGLVVFEAAAQGLPAIVDADCAAAEFVSRSGGGVIVDGRDLNSIRDAMEKLLDPAVAERLGANAYDAFWSNPPTLERHVRELETVYATALGDRK